MRNSAVGDEVWVYISNAISIYDIPIAPELVTITRVTPTYVEGNHIYQYKYNFKTMYGMVEGYAHFYSCKEDAMSVYIKDLKERYVVLNKQLKITKELLSKEKAI